MSIWLFFIGERPHTSRTGSFASCPFQQGYLTCGARCQAIHHSQYQRSCELREAYRFSMLLEATCSEFLSSMTLYAGFVPVAGVPYVMKTQLVRSFVQINSTTSHRRVQSSSDAYSSTGRKHSSDVSSNGGVRTDGMRSKESSDRLVHFFDLPTHLELVDYQCPSLTSSGKLKDQTAHNVFRVLEIYSRYHMPECSIITCISSSRSAAAGLAKIFVTSALSIREHAKNQQQPPC